MNGQSAGGRWQKLRQNAQLDVVGEMVNYDVGNLARLSGKYQS